MSKKDAVDALSLRGPDRVPSFEVLEHPSIVKKVSGIDPYEDPVRAYLKALPLLEIDWVVDIPDRAVRFETERSTIEQEDGTLLTEWGCSGSVWEEDFKFRSPEEVLKYRPLEDTTGRVRVVGSSYQKPRIDRPREHRKQAGNTVLITGLYYTTLFQFGIMSFGWENFLTAAALGPETFGIILDQFTEISVRNITEMVNDDCPVFFFHDDLAITRGLVCPPEWYRREIFPRYEKILEPARKAGKRIVFVSDGRFEELIPDLIAVGIDGIHIDSSNDLESVLKRYGEDHAVIGNIDTQVLTWGDYEDIKKEVTRCAELGRRYPGYMFKSSGDVPHNIPIENVEAYTLLKRELGRR